MKMEGLLRWMNTFMNKLETKERETTIKEWIKKSRFYPTLDLIVLCLSLLKI